MITIGYTIHNKGHLIPRVLEGLNLLPKDTFALLVLFDACEDNSQEIFNKEMEKYDFDGIQIDPGEELFEVKANNRLLKIAQEEMDSDITILFQDDMVIDDPKLIEKVLRVCEVKNHGLIGGRMGFDIVGTGFPEKIDNVLYSWSHYLNPGWGKLGDGQFASRKFLNRGPIVFTRELIEGVGYLNEEYYPLWGDDMDYCARCITAGRTNMVFESKIISEPSWGTTRKGTKVDMKKVMRTNWNKFTKDWGHLL